jgi:hypothetical protein
MGPQNNNNKHADAGTNYCFTQLRVLLVLQAPRHWFSQSRSLAVSHPRDRVLQEDLPRNAKFAQCFEKEVARCRPRPSLRLDETWSNCSLNHVKCSLNHVNCSLNRVNCSLNHVKCSLNHVNCSLNHVNCSLNHVNCSGELGAQGQRYRLVSWSSVDCFRGRGGGRSHPNTPPPVPQNSP